MVSTSGSSGTRYLTPSDIPAVLPALECDLLGEFATALRSLQDVASETGCAQHTTASGPEHSAIAQHRPGLEQQGFIGELERNVNL